MMAASSADYKDDGREEKKEPVTEEGSKPISTSDVSLHMAGTTSSKREDRRRAYCTLTVPIIILYAVVGLGGVGAFVYMFHLQNQVNDLMHSCAQLNEDGIQTPWQQNVSIQLINLASALSELQHDLDSTTRDFLATKSRLEVNISQLNARANSTDAQLRDLAFSRSEMQYNLTSTRQEFLASNSAIDSLTVRANSTELQLENLTATLGEAQKDFQQTISRLRAEVFSEVSTVESQLNTYANSTDAQLRDLNSTLSEMQHNLTSTRQELLASKSAIDSLTVRANNTELHLRNVTSTLGELHGDIDDNQHQLKNLSSLHEELEQKIHQITLNMLTFHKNVSLSQEIHAREISALQINLSSLNSQVSTIRNGVEQLQTRHNDQIQRLSNEQSRIDARLREIEAKVNSASTLSTASLYIVILTTFLCCLCN